MTALLSDTKWLLLPVRPFRLLSIIWYTSEIINEISRRSYLWNKVPGGCAMCCAVERPLYMRQCEDAWGPAKAADDHRKLKLSIAITRTSKIAAYFKCSIGWMEFLYFYNTAHTEWEQKPNFVSIEDAQNSTVVWDQWPSRIADVLTFHTGTQGVLEI